MSNGNTTNSKRHFLYRIDYAPVSVKDILIKMKNLASLMVGLAYYSILYDDRKLAKEVYNLEELVDFLNLQLIMQASIATRSAKDAKRMISVFRLASAIDKISNAAADIAAIAFAKRRTKIMASAITSSRDMIARIKIRQGSSIVGKSLREIHKILDIVFDVIAVRRNTRWILEPKSDLIVNLNDVLIVRGSEEAIELLRNAANDYKEQRKAIELLDKDIINDMIKLKEISELMVYLAYMSIMTRSAEISEYVLNLEDYVDNLYVKYMMDSIKSKSNLPSEDIVALLRIATATETIADAAAEIAEIIVRGLDPHPILTDVIQKGLEQIISVKVPNALNNVKVRELELENYGAHLLAIRRNSEWIVNPKGDEVLYEGDLLLIRCYEESANSIRQKFSKR
ncbi:MAG: hypothetical protein J7J99_08480 [Thermoprotei archaeon]|nr:hypothetical protein [Thermoprotei archaeon]